MRHGVPQRNHGYIEGVGRLRLHYRTWEVEEPRAALIVVHGLYEHSRRYQELAEVMGSYGFSTFALDLRGHGESEGRRGHVPRFHVLLQDLDRFRREVQGLVDIECPLFLIGHSLGGLIAVRYLEEYDTPLAGAVISSPWLGTAHPIPRWKILLAHIGNRLLPALPVSDQIDVDRLSHDPARNAEYREDPLIHKTVTPRMFSEISSAIDLAMRRGDRIHTPVLFLLAGDDRLVDTDRSLAFARSLERDRVTTEVLEGFYHEIYQETGRAAVFNTVQDWLTDHIP